MSMYLDSAATTPIHPKVQKAMDSVQSIFGNTGSKHYEGYRAKEILDTALQTIAHCLGVKKEQIIPTYGGTDANRKVLWAMRKRFSYKNLWASSVEHTSIRDEIAKENQFNPFSFQNIPENPSFLSLMQTNNETGVLFDTKKLRQRYPQAIFHSDWVQAIGKQSFTPELFDFASFSAHKLYGPKTVGLLYIKHPDEFPELSQDSHTKNIQLIVGMAKAFELLNQKTIQTIEKQTKYIESFIAQSFKNTKIIHKDKNRVPGIISIAFQDIRGSELMTRLSEEERICVSTGSACSSDIFAPTQVIQIFEPNPKYQYPIRIGLHQFVTNEQVEEFCEILKYMVDDMRK